MIKRRVGILYGGRSVEHDISILSARNIVQNIDQSQFDIFLFAIDKNGNWYYMKSIGDQITKGLPLDLSLNAEKPTFKAGEEEIVLDVVFPILHGTDGEDGAIQGLLQTLSLPYVGSGVMGSAVAMDKLISKKIMEAYGINLAKYLSYTESEINNISYEEVCSKLSSPIIVKPVNLGSSVGVSKVSSETEFKRAITDAFQYDHTILIEEFISGREVECAILGNDRPIVSVAGEITLSDHYDFYSFAAKYEDPESTIITIPANMTQETHNRIKELSLKAYQALNCADLSRVDLFVTDKDEVYVNEVNTIPGFTNISMYPSLIRHEGIEYQQLITKLLEMAIERNNSDGTITTNYESQL